MTTARPTAHRPASPRRSWRVLVAPPFRAADRSESNRVAQSFRLRTEGTRLRGRQACGPGGRDDDARRVVAAWLLQGGSTEAQVAAPRTSRASGARGGWRALR